ncbi:MAG: FAD-binding oxidoreductase [Chloroflexota bacterium]|nr:FAD-binding oxidoreductase [Chloroflexota bacterium]
MTILQPVRRTRRSGLWLDEALADEPDAEPIEPLSGAHRSDVCVVGGGYTGLWTALRLKELEPALDVVVLEADLCGAGASGRNGGFALSWWPKLRSLIKLCGDEEAMRLARASEDAIAEIGRFCTRHGIEAHFRQAGWLWTATSAAQLGAWEARVRACEARGVDAFRRLPPEEVAARTGSAVHVGGVCERSGATIQPARLARGLRRIAISRGVRVFERSTVLELRRSRPPLVRTPRGTVIADRVVLAINAWASSLPDLRRAILPMSSDVIATEPLGERLTEIGWSGGESISDARLMVHYYRTTTDGRIVFGRAGEAHAYLGRITPTLDRLRNRGERTVEAFRRADPQLRTIRTDHRWTGAVDRSETNLPFFGHLDGHSTILYGVGYSGNGVAPSLVGANILASSALGRDDEWSASPVNRGPRSAFPPDPVRYFGGIAVRAAVRRKEAAEDAGRRASGPILALAGFAPSGMHKGGVIAASAPMRTTGAARDAGPAA